MRSLLNEEESVRPAPAQRATTQGQGQRSYLFYLQNFVKLTHRTLKVPIINITQKIHQTH